MASRFSSNLSSPFAFWGRNLLLVFVATGGTIFTVGAIANSQNPSKPTQPTPSQTASKSPQPAPTPWPSPHSSQPSPKGNNPKQPPQNPLFSHWLSGLRFIEQHSPEYPVENTRPLTPNQPTPTQLTPNQPTPTQKTSPRQPQPQPRQRRARHHNPFTQFLAQSKPPDSPTPEKPSQPENRVPLTLEEVVQLTVTNNTPIQNAYLDRIVQRASLRTAQGEFDPKLTPTLRTQLTGDGEDLDIENTQEQIQLGAEISLLLPTGGEIQVDWRSQLRSLNALTTDDSLRQGVTLSFNQPLLRDAGPEITRLNLNRALVQEDINLLELRDTLSTEIIRSIQLYRQLLQQQEQVNNTQLALENAKKALERQQALVEAGREAEFRLLASEQNVTEFESQLIQAQNAVQSARLALLNQLGIERELPIMAVENVTEATQTPVKIATEEVEQMAFNNRPDYLIRLLNLRLAEFNVVEAKNNRQWRLDLETQYNQAFTDQADVSAQLVLTRRLGNQKQDEENFERARVNLLQQENTLELREEEIRTEISDRIREIQLQFRQIELAQQAVTLAQRNLEAQEALVDAGEGNPFELREAQERLLNAKNRELQRRINYLNSLTELQRTQGTTLQQWGIRLERDS